MATAKVYHAINPTFREEPQRFPEDYELVAEVKAEGEYLVDFAFQQTNHIDEPWYFNDGVTLIKESRSTSVGDIIEIDRRRYLCCNVGWKQL